MAATLELHVRVKVWLLVYNIKVMRRGTRVERA